MRAGQCAPWPTGEAYQNCLQAHVSEITARVNSTTHFFAVAEEMEPDGVGPLLAAQRPSPEGRDAIPTGHSSDEGAIRSGTVLPFTLVRLARTA